MRLFIAINFSDEIKTTLLGAVRELKSQAISGNFTRPENLHLTLAFIGETDNVAAVRKVLDNINESSFDMTVKGSGNFGNLFWVGIENNPKLKNLAEEIKRDLRECGFEIEDKAFKPHITLARQLETNVPISLNVEEKSMTVSRISLMKSERINGKLTYTEIYERTLN